MGDSIAGDMPPTYRFGDFRLDPSRRSLCRNGEPVVVQPKVFDLIVHLVEQRERAVSKDDLQDAVWPRQVITETALTRAVMKARKALDDDANQPRMIATLQTHGYHFIAPVTVETPEGTPIGTAEPRPARREWPWLPITAVLLLGTLVMLWLWRKDVAEAPALSGHERARLAILPIENASGDSRFDWTRLGLVAGVIDYLQTARAADAVPIRNVTRLIETTHPPMGSDADLADLARTFSVTDGATHVVAATIEPDAGALRLRYRLVDRSGQVRNRTLVGSSPARLMTGLATDLSAQFDGGRSSARVSEDPFANEAYLRGKAAYLSGDYEAARTLLQSALSEVPEALWPRLELALIARNERQFDDSEAQFLSLIEDARKAGDAAVEFSATNSLGNLYLLSERIDQAEVRWREALALAEKRDDPFWIGKAYHNLSIAANVKHDDAMSRESIRKAADAFTRAGFEVLPPQLAMKMGDQYHDDGELETAEHYIEQSIHGYRTLGIVNAEAAATSDLASLRWDQGRLDEAAALFTQTTEMLRRLQHQERALGQALGALGLLYGQRGDAEAAQAAFELAQPLLESLPERIPLAALELRRARVLLRGGNTVAAEPLLHAALEHYREGHLAYGEALTLAFLAKLHAARKQLPQADDFTTQAERVAAESRSAEARMEASDARIRTRMAREGANAVRQDWSDFHGECLRQLPGRPYLCARRQLDAALEMIRAGQTDVASEWIDAVRSRMPRAPGLDSAQSVLEQARKDA